jgi:biopolymer transport protein ExbD
MKLNRNKNKKVRIEMLPLIDIVFLLLVFFIYAMLSMAVHRSLPVMLPTSTTAKIDKHQVLSVTVKTDGSTYLDKEPIALSDLAAALKRRSGGNIQTGILLFADRSLTYQKLFRALDQIRLSGLSRISLQAEKE